MMDINLNTLKTKCCKNRKDSGKLVWLPQNNFYWKIWLGCFLGTVLAKTAMQWQEDKAVEEALRD